MTEDEALWKKRFQMFALVRLVGLALFFLGMAVALTDLVRPGGWPLVGGILAVIGIVEAVVAPRILKTVVGQDVKRFWTDASVVETENGYGVALDGKPLKTPARVPLAVPVRALAEAIVAEWDAVSETIDPRAMPMTGLANAAIDRGDAEMVAGIVRYAESDQFCYRAEGPTPLVERQSEAWDALLNWTRRRYDIDFVTCSGILHVAQPPETIRKLGHEVAILDRFRLAGLSPLVTIGGSLVAGLAVLEQAIPADAAWEAVSLDERWQLEKWGSDAEAEAALDAKRCDFLAAARFLELLS